MIWFGPGVPIGIFIYAWSTEYKVHWIVPIIGTAFLGIGVMMVTSSSQLYMMDMYGPEGAASALAAATLVRNGYGAFLPLLHASLRQDPAWAGETACWGLSPFCSYLCPYFFTSTAAIYRKDFLLSFRQDSVSIFLT